MTKQPPKSFLHRIATWARTVHGRDYYYPVWGYDGVQWKAITARRYLADAIYEADWMVKHDIVYQIIGVSDALMSKIEYLVVGTLANSSD